VVIVSNAASFKRPLLLVDVSTCLGVCVCLSATLMLNFSKTKPFIGSCPTEAYRKVPMACRLVTSTMTSRDSMMSYSWRHNIQSRRIQKLGSGSAISVDSLSKH